MAIKLLSFDLQGTVTDHGFSSELWLTLLPKVFKDNQSKMTKQSFEDLLRDFKAIDEDDRRYYDMNYWLKRAYSEEKVISLVKKVKNKPRIFPLMQKIVREFNSNIPVIVISATTNEFIRLELGEFATEFTRLFSTYDDFSVAGKPSEVFSKVSKGFGFREDECLHIGDHFEMDCHSPKEAGWHSLYVPSEISEEIRAEKVRRFFTESNQ